MVIFDPIEIVRYFDWNYHIDCTRSWYSLPVRTALRTARIYGCIFDTRIYGPYVRVSKSSPVYTGRMYGPYRSPVKSQNIYLQTLRHYWLFCNQNVLNSTNIRCCGIKTSTSRRDHCRPRTVCPSIAENTQRHALRSHSFHQFEIWTKNLQYRSYSFYKKRNDGKYLPLCVMNDVAWRHQQFRTKYFVSIVIDRGFCYTARTYGPYVRAAHGCQKCTRIHGP